MKKLLKKFFKRNRVLGKVIFTVIYNPELNAVVFRSKTSRINPKKVFTFCIPRWSIGGIKTTPMTFSREVRKKFDKYLDEFFKDVLTKFSKKYGSGAAFEGKITKYIRIRK